MKRNDEVAARGMVLSGDAARISASNGRPVFPLVTVVYGEEGVTAIGGELLK